MLNTMAKTAKSLSVRTQTLAAAAAVIAAVALPQLFHFIGSVSGLGTALGETFLPMHLPVILVGLLAGPYAGAVSGLLSPLISFALSGMPGAAMLPFMIIELTFYGLSAGILKNVRMPSLAKVAAVQISGRLIRAGAILLAAYAIGNNAVSASVIYKSIPAGLPGLILQWTLIPLFVFWIDNRNKNEQ